MISLLEQIVSTFVCWVQTGVTLVLNGTIIAIGAAASGLLAILPPFPNLPTTPTWVTQGFAYGNYFFPLTFLVDLITSTGVIFLTLSGMMMALRYFRVVE